MSDPITGAGIETPIADTDADEPRTDADGDGRFATAQAVPAAVGSPEELGRVITDPTVRRRLYQAYTVLAAIATLTTVGFAAAGAVPKWLVVANAVVAAAGAYAGFLAASNTKKKD